MYWPIVTVEAKGPDGTHYQCHLQNEHNAAIMLNNRLQLKRKANLPIPYDQAVVFTIDMASFIVELNCHWVSAGENGEDIFWGKQLKCWNLHDESPEYFNSARQSIRNCIEWARHNALSEIRSDLTALRVLRLQASSSLASISMPNQTLRPQQILNVATPDPQLDMVLGANSSASVPSHVPNDSSASGRVHERQVTPLTSTSSESIPRDESNRRRKQTPSMDLDSEFVRRTYSR